MRYRVNADAHNLVHFQFTQVYQTPAQTVEGTVSQVGGQMSLFLGASVLSLIHAVVYLLNKVFYCCRGNEVDEDNSDKDKKNDDWSSAVTDVTVSGEKFEPPPIAAGS